MSHFAMFEEENARAVKTDSPLTAARVAFEKENHHAWVWAQTIVRAAPVEVVAWVWDSDNRDKVNAAGTEKRVVEVSSRHSKIVYVRAKGKGPISDRSFVGRMLWKATDDGGYIAVTEPEELEAMPREDGVVRGGVYGALRIVDIGNDESRIDMVVQAHFGGQVPAWATTKMYVRGASEASAFAA
jgi:hypothetical protein